MRLPERSSRLKNAVELSFFSPFAGREEDQHVVDRVGVLHRVERELERLAAQDGPRIDALRDRARRRVVAAEDEDGGVLGLERLVERPRVVLLDDRDAGEVVAVLRAADLDRDELVAARQAVGAADVLRDLEHARVGRACGGLPARPGRRRPSGRSAGRARSGLRPRRRPRRRAGGRPPRSGRGCLDRGPCLRLREVDPRDLQLGRLEDLDELVAEELLLLDQRLGDLLDRLLVVRDQARRP